MNEYETDPQRHENSTTEESSPQPADASHEGGSPQRGQSDTTAAQDVVANPAAPVPYPGTPQGAPQSAVPQSAVPQSAVPQSSAPQSPWQQPQPLSPWQQPQAPQQQPAPGYGQPQQYYGQPQQYAYAGQQPPQYGAPQGGWQAADATQIGWTNGDPTQPAWAVPVGAEEKRRDPRGRRILITAAVAVLIALGAGGVGAATAMAFSDNNGSSGVTSGSSSVTRVVDRSSLAQIAAAVQDSVVSITTEEGEGSGVILNTDGDILTNNHVVATATGKTVEVIFANGDKSTATIVGTDPRSDMAVVKVSGVSGLKPAVLGDSSQMQVGDTVLALGSPLGLEGSVTAGIISAKDRTIQSSSEDSQDQQGQTDPFGQQGQSQSQSSSTTTTLTGLLQTDAPINPGNSGGALVNTNGQVIGINSAIATSGTASGNIGLGFAIPSNKARTVAQDLMAGKTVSHAALGVSVTEAQGGGALVSAVTAKSGAAQAGLQQGDVIKSVNGKDINTSDDLVAIIQGAAVGDKVTIVFTRDGAEKTVSATLTEAS
jgi:putative serine protease PepD